MLDRDFNRKSPDYLDSVSSLFEGESNENKCENAYILNCFGSIRHDYSYSFYCSYINIRHIRKTAMVYELGNGYL
jgi:hypothetical protein